MAMNAQPIIENNHIYENQCIGLYFRDVCGGVCNKNTI